MVHQRHEDTNILKHIMSTTNTLTELLRKSLEEAKDDRIGTNSKELERVFSKAAKSIFEGGHFKWHESNWAVWHRLANENVDLKRDYIVALDAGWSKRTGQRNTILFAGPKSVSGPWSIGTHDIADRQAFYECLGEDYLVGEENRKETDPNARALVYNREVARANA
jgi:hypothetical protein